MPANKPGSTPSMPAGDTLPAGDTQIPGTDHGFSILFGAVTWPSEQDIAPETLRAGMVPVKREDPLVEPFYRGRGGKKGSVAAWQCRVL